MTDELTTPISVEQRVKDRIKDEFVNLISDEQWAYLVGRTVKEFTEDSGDVYNKRRSPLRTMIEDALKEHAKERIDEELSKLKQTDVKGMIAQLITPDVLLLIQQNLLSDYITNMIYQRSSDVASMLRVQACSCGQSTVVGVSGSVVACNQCGASNQLF